MSTGGAMPGCTTSHIVDLFCILLADSSTVPDYFLYQRTIALSRRGAASDDCEAEDV